LFFYKNVETFDFVSQLFFSRFITNNPLPDKYCYLGGGFLLNVH
jgi:hypothetical protein